MGIWSSQSEVVNFLLGILLLALERGKVVKAFCWTLVLCCCCCWFDFISNNFSRKNKQSVQSAEWRKRTKVIQSWGGKRTEEKTRKCFHSLCNFHINFNFTNIGFLWFLVFLSFSLHCFGLLFQFSLFSRSLSLTTSIANGLIFLLLLTASLPNPCDGLTSCKAEKAINHMRKIQNVDSYVYNDTHLLNINNKGIKVNSKFIDQRLRPNCLSGLKLIWQQNQQTSLASRIKNSISYIASPFFLLHHFISFISPSSFSI